MVGRQAAAGSWPLTREQVNTKQTRTPCLFRIEPAGRNGSDDAAHHLAVPSPLIREDNAVVLWSLEPARVASHRRYRASEFSSVTQDGHVDVDKAKLVLVSFPSRAAVSSPLPVQKLVLFRLS
jgi:hypothetical protein